MEYIYAYIIPFRQFSPYTALLCIPQTWRNCPGPKLLFTSEQQGREVKHSSGALQQHPILRMLYTYRAAIRKQGSFFFSEAERCTSFTERMRLTFCLCHMVSKTTRKEYGILYLYSYLYCYPYYFISILLY